MQSKAWFPTFQVQLLVNASKVSIAGRLLVGFSFLCFFLSSCEKNQTKAQKKLPGAAAPIPSANRVDLSEHQINPLNPELANASIEVMRDFVLSDKFNKNHYAAFVDWLQKLSATKGVSAGTICTDFLQGVPDSNQRMGLGVVISFALTSNPDAFIPAAYENFQGRDRSFVLGGYISSVEKMGNPDLQKSLYDALPPGRDRERALMRWTKSVLNTGDPRSALDLARTFEYPEERRQALSQLISTLRTRKIAVDPALLEEIVTAAEENGVKRSRAQISARENAPIE